MDRVAPNPLALEIVEASDFCTFNWNTRDGWPMGATVSFQWIDERIWFSMDAAEGRIKAIRRDPRVAVVWRTPSQTVTVKGRCRIEEGLERKRLVYRKIAENTSRMTGGKVDADEYAHVLESKGSIVLEVIPLKWIAYEGKDGTRSISPSA